LVQCLQKKDVCQLYLIMSQVLLRYFHDYKCSSSCFCYILETALRFLNSDVTGGCPFLPNQLRCFLKKKKIDIETAIFQVHVRRILFPFFGTLFSSGEDCTYLLDELTF
jgi:hypothetical protein